MSKFISVSVKQTANDSSSATYECTVSKLSSSYFGICQYYNCLVIWKAGSNGKGQAYKHWGFPVRSSWKASWGEPSWYLWGGNYFKSQYGNLDGFLGNTYKWTETVTIDRGNSREGTKEITVGVKAGKNTSTSFGTTLKTITLKTTRIPDPSNVVLNQPVVDEPNVENRTLTVTASFVNPENYYTARLYKDGVQVPFTNNTYTMNITKEMYNTNPKFELRIFGKDNTYYKEFTKEVRAYIAPSGVGLTVKHNGEPKEIDNAYFRNVTNKEIKEIWIKKNGKIYKTIK